MSTFGEAIKEHILSIRAQYPRWGAAVIHAELSADPRFSKTSIPSVRTIGLALKEAGLIKRYNKRVVMPNSQRVQATSPHHVWQMDAQGSFNLKHIGPIAMINIKDVFSHIYCMAYPNQKKSIFGYSKRLDYQCALRLAFMENGLPQVIQTDHEGVFHENKGGSPFPTVFHLWLIGLGITKVLSRVNRPTDQGMVERMHQTMDRQVIQGLEHSSWQGLFEFCQQRRYFLNQMLPCTSLGGQAPYKVFAKQKHSGRFYQPHLEEHLLDLNRIYAYLEKGKWYRWTSQKKAFTLGGIAYRAKSLPKKTQVLITFTRKDLMLNIHDDKELLVQKIPIQGITKKALMGDLFWKMTNVQLELPLCWDTRKVSTTLLHNT